MKTLSLETTKLLDKLYNLRGNDSVILVEMDKQKEKSESTLERTTQEKLELQTKIANLETEHEQLETQGEKLKDVLKGIDKNEFQIVLESLNIDFDPETLSKKVEENLPKTIDKVTKEQETAEKELVSVEDEMNDAITTIDELGIRRDAALANQAKLNEYFELALNGKINITRDSITSLLEQFDFTAEEQREAAKILMFPEDALYEYNAKVVNSDIAGKTISEVISEAKDAIEEEEKDFDSVVEEKTINENKFFESPIIEENNQIFEEPAQDLEPVKEEQVFNPFLIDDNSEQNEETNEESDINIDEFVLDEVPLNEISSNDKNVNVEEFLNEEGFSYLDFTSSDLDELKENFDKELFSKNINIIKNNNIDLDIFVEHSSLLYDKELEDKINLLLNIGKEAIDIYLNPSVLIKYTKEKLDNAIALLKSNGMDPKNVPLMAY